MHVFRIGFQLQTKDKKGKYFKRKNVLGYKNNEFLPKYKNSEIFKKSMVDFKDTFRLSNIFKCGDK